jgi:hypothetical protein
MKISKFQAIKNAAPGDAGRRLVVDGSTLVDALYNDRNAGLSITKMRNTSFY